MTRKRFEWLKRINPECRIIAVHSPDEVTVRDPSGGCSRISKEFFELLDEAMADAAGDEVEK